jgi:exopolyphosphatase/guanosine-5'-triphosphate,3'-diphosphate pyrophosphatase
VTYTRRYFPDGAIGAKAFQRAEVAARSELEELAAGFDRWNWDEAFGSSGTAGAIAAILEANGWDGEGISLAGMQRLRSKLIEAGHVRKLAIKSLREDRAPVLAAGLAIVMAIFKQLGVERMRTASGALRLGVLYDLLGRRLNSDTRDATIARLQTRFGVDRAQAARAQATALALFAALRPEASEESRRLLGWAAAMHEAGFALSHHNWHKHSAYIVGNADMPGFSTGDQQRLSTLLLGQRGNLRKLGEAFEEPGFAPLLLALRLALLLCHARRDLELPPIEPRLETGLRIDVEASWLDAHPLTAHLLAEEAQAWADAGFGAKVIAR